MLDGQQIRRFVSRQRLAFGALAKPVGAACNLDCTYCYCLHQQARRRLLRPQCASGALLVENALQPWWRGGSAPLIR